MTNRIAYDQPLPDITRSRALAAQASELIPAATQTLAKGPSQLVDGVAPRFLSHGSGCRVWDVDGNEFIDLAMGVGPLILGYCHPSVDAAIQRQLARGITFSLVHPLEVEVATSLRQVVPHADGIRFSKTGCDVTSAAVRVARAFTRRDRVLCCGYHGWHDWYVGTTSRHAGVPEVIRQLTSTFTYNDLDSVTRQLDEEVACVILEPILFEQPRAGFLQELRRACDRVGALLIFDEMWTGFRLALGGAQQVFDVRADLACFSKAVANGMPLSVLTGRADVMRLLDEEVFFFTTFGGEALSLAAAQATLEELRGSDALGQIAARGAELQDAYNGLAERHGLGFTRCVGPSSRSLVAFDGSAGDPLVFKSLLQQELLRHGVLWTGFHNLALAHDSAAVSHVIGAYDRALGALASAWRRGSVRDELRGTPVRPVFRKIS